MDLNTQLFTIDTEMNNYLITSCRLTSKITSVAQTYLAEGLWMQETILALFGFSTAS